MNILLLIKFNPALLIVYFYLMRLSYISRRKNVYYMNQNSAQHRVSVTVNSNYTSLKAQLVQS